VIRDQSKQNVHALSFQSINPWLGTVVMSTIQLLGEAQVGETWVQTSPGIKQDSISKITSDKRAGRVAQVVEHCLASKRP
jgi:hypothetical protein